ncbi:MAG: B12-binding domain-containing radical SAM protein [Planctomycetes bacterium]|nr:B12-binding domain-containing radical SAM protein [Planctomycetota bacterium]
MKILFIRPPRSQNGPPGQALGLLDLGACLERDGHHVRILDLIQKPEITIREFIRTEMDGVPDVVGFSCLTVNAAESKKLADEARALGVKTIIAGGIHYSVYPEKALEYADYVFLGEAEISLANAMRDGFPEEKIIPSIHLDNLDDIPEPSDILLKDVYEPLTDGMAMVMTSRGCPFSCSFCLDSKYRSRKIRRYSPARIAQKLHRLNDLFHPRLIFIVDDIFTTDREGVIKCCDEIDRLGKLPPMSFHHHVKFGDVALFKRMRRSGFFSSGVGMESGNDQILKATGKSITTDDIRKSVRELKKARIEVLGFFLLGLPGETKETLRETLNFAKELNVRCSFHFAIPYPGSRLHEQAQELGSLTTDNFAFYSIESPIFIPEGTTEEELLAMMEEARKVERCLRKRQQRKIAFYRFINPLVRLYKKLRGR